MAEVLEGCERARVVLAQGTAQRVQLALSGVGHENLLVVKTSDISTKPGGSLCQVPRCATNLVTGYS
jgi:hypothetical protein